MKAAQAVSEEVTPGAPSVKVVLVGDGGCGKTSLLMVFADGAFPEVSASPSGTAPASSPWPALTVGGRRHFSLCYPERMPQ